MYTFAFEFTQKKGKLQPQTVAQQKEQASASARVPIGGGLQNMQMHPRVLRS